VPALPARAAPPEQGRREELTASIERLGTGHLVHWTGFVADEDLTVLHEAALANVLASECEGFGLPAVEAAASGTAWSMRRRARIAPYTVEGNGGNTERR